MASARKLKSGAWNIRVYDYTDAEGRVHHTSLTAPTKAEAEFMAAQYVSARPKGKRRQKADLTVREAVEKYIERSSVLSPTTILGYKRMLNYGFPELMSRKVKDLDDDAMQAAINNECRRPSAKLPGKAISTKTVINEWGLLASALKSICGTTYTVRLPKKQQHIKELPAPETVFSMVRGTSIELPCLLAMWLSFSMSEIRGLMCSSVHDGCVIISQVKVDAEDGEVIKENAKTSTRLRMHRLPPYLLQLIEDTEEYRNYAQTGADGPLVPLNHSQIYGRWKHLCKKHGIVMTFHDLRHMSASIMLALGVPDKYAMERGGWSTPHVMKSVYQHTLSAERQRIDAVVDGYFESLLVKELAQKLGTSPENAANSSTT